MKTQHSLTYVILFVPTIARVSGQEDFNENRLLYQRNKVKSIKVYDFKYKNGKVKGKGKLLSYDLYDSTGFKTCS